MTISEEISARIEIFSTCIRVHGIERAYADHVHAHDCAIVGNGFERSLRQVIAAHFGVDLGSVFVVGSAKLGFSPKPGQYFKAFSDQSDIDVAIVCRDLYARIWHEVAEMERANEYFDLQKFRHYHFLGWIRPDKMPSSAEYDTCRKWWEFFQDLSGREEFLRMKISAGLYHDERFLRRYQLSSLLGLRDHLEAQAE